MGCIMFIGTPRGAFTPILNLFVEVPPRVFLGILLEYCTHKYSPELVNKDFGDFLGVGYIVYRHPPVVHAQGVRKKFFSNIYVALQGFLKYPLENPQSLQTFFLLLFLKVEIFLNYNLEKNQLNTWESLGGYWFLYQYPPCVKLDVCFVFLKIA